MSRPKRTRSEQEELERKVRVWGAVVAGCGAALAATASQDPAMGLLEKWLALAAPGVIFGVAAAVGGAAAIARASVRAGWP